MYLTCRGSVRTLHEYEHLGRLQGRESGQKAWVSQGQVLPHEPDRQAGGPY